MYYLNFTKFLLLLVISSLVLFGSNNAEEEFYILPDFVVTDDDDKGYYSANTLAGTRTNELTKNIPMTISTVNEEMIEDFKMKTLEDLGNFVPSIEAEGNVYNNQEIRFRGLLTKSQLYEFMPRYSPLDWYNVGRSDIIRGANSLIYGQADPGGKVNVISKTANLNKDKGSSVIEIGDKSWHKYTFDYNKVIGDSTAARIMFVDKHREFDAKYKYQKFTGTTFEFLQNFGPKTRFRLHLEEGEAERSLIGGTFKVGQTPTGLPNGIVADPKLADLISDELLDEIAKYSDLNEFDGVNYESIYPNVFPNGLYEPGENYSDLNFNDEWDFGEPFDDIGDGNRVYGFIDRDGDGILEKNIIDTNGNDKLDEASRMFAFIDLNNDQKPSYSGTIETPLNDNDGNLVYTEWNPINERAVGAYVWDNSVFNDITESNGMVIAMNAPEGLEGTDTELWRSRIVKEIDLDPGYAYIQVKHEDMPAYISNENEIGEKILFTWEDKNENGILDYRIDEESGEYIFEEKVSFEDLNANGQLDLSYDQVIRQDGGSNTIKFDDYTYAINPVNGDEFVLVSEDFIDWNKNGIYDDADYASGGLHVRANFPNTWGFSPGGGSLVPDFIDSREDIRKLFKGINSTNTGTGFGPDAYSRKKFDYVLADIDHIFNDGLSIKTAVAFEDLIDDQLSSGWSANQINFSSGYGITVRYPTLRSINNYYNEVTNINNNDKSPFEAVLVDLTNANYAHLILDNLEEKTMDEIRGGLKDAIDAWSGNLNQLSPHQDAFVDINSNGLEDEMVDYFVDEFLFRPLSKADTTLEKYYEIAKFGGRVKDFLRRSHAQYGKNYDYAWGRAPDSGGRSLGDLFYDVLTGSEDDLGAPENDAVMQIYNLDRYVDVSTYQRELSNFSKDELLLDSNYREIDDPLYQKGGALATLLNPAVPKDHPIFGPHLKNAADFSLTEVGERLIYDSIPDWLISGNNLDREMLALPGVEIFTYGDSSSQDNFIDPTDSDEIALQKRAIAKRVYSILVDEDQESVENNTNTFWDATKEVYDFFKYELHPEDDLSSMWEKTIQPALLVTLDAIIEDENYLDEGNIFNDTDNDGVTNALPSLVKTNVEILQPFIKRQWKRSSNRDNNKSSRITFSYDEPKDVQVLFGIDLDNRKASRSEEQLVSLNARTWGDPFSLYLRDEILSDYVLLDDIIYNREGSYEEFDFNISGHQYDGAPNWITNSRIPLDEKNISKWAQTYYADSQVRSNALWIAASGSYLDGRLRTLMGVRRDSIKTETEYSRFTLKSASNPELENVIDDWDDTITTPSFGGLFWINKNLAIFGNFSESVISPNGFQFDVFGEITPPETGSGKEIGFKMSTQDNVINGQLTFFKIDKKNEQRQNISWPMLTAIYPAKNPDGTKKETPYENGKMPDVIYDYYIYENKYTGEPMRDQETQNILYRAEFNPKGFRVADEEVRSEGLELDFYYNPTKNLSFFMGYAYLDTVVLKSQLNALEGLPTAGTSDHNLNLTAKYSFKQGRFKGLQVGINQKYRSAALLSHYFVDLDGDNQADYISRDITDPKSGKTVTLKPRYNTLWLEDQHNTDLFIKWSGKFTKYFPWTVMQMNINNIFDNRNLISTGLNNARYTEGRNIVFSSSFYF